ncbi:TPA: hypothetical protein DIV55_05585 [Patescibacteria group bacterium]|uniref:VanZ-like protein n=1 Tax=Candidatus Gottesmanbacteria bacterium GW2011_GWA1_43_11 TaxID=1618436 RepID=A0A0G1F8K6_9BACT|nr:MAG: VanZ-like protein [Candidatus Gottesmanbacteria bacterium GW2011_GWA1_43_11]HCS79180.1 hypothetical protein [Patescibacteria group bacterium]
MKTLLYWLPTVFWMSLIFFLSSRASVKVSDTQVVQFLFFKTLHVVEYAILYVLLFRSLKNTYPAPLWQNRYNALLIAVTYGMTDEVHQMFVPTREGAFRDVIIDTMGISLAAISLWKLLPPAPKPLKALAKKLAIL